MINKISVYGKAVTYSRDKHTEIEFTVNPDKTVSIEITGEEDFTYFTLAEEQVAHLAKFLGSYI